MPRSKKTQPDETLPSVSFPSAWHAMGDPRADSMVAKAVLVSALMDAIEARELTQTAAAELLGIPRPNLSRLCSGQFQSVTFDRLFDLLNKMGLGVRVTFQEGSAGVYVEQAAS